MEFPSHQTNRVHSFPSLLFGTLSVHLCDLHLLYLEIDPLCDLLHLFLVFEGQVQLPLTLKGDIKQRLILRDPIPLNHLDIASLYLHREWLKQPDTLIVRLGFEDFDGSSAGAGDCEDFGDGAVLVEAVAANEKLWALHEDRVVRTVDLLEMDCALNLRGGLDQCVLVFLHYLWRDRHILLLVEGDEAGSGLVAFEILEFQGRKG